MSLLEYFDFAYEEKFANLSCDLYYKYQTKSYLLFLSVQVKIICAKRFEYKWRLDLYLYFVAFRGFHQNLHEWIEMLRMFEIIHHCWGAARNQSRRFSELPPAI